MLKYKKAFLLAIVFSITVFIYTFLIIDQYRNIRIINIHMYNDYAYMFVLFCVLFYLYFENNDYDLMVYRFQKIGDYFVFKIKHTILSVIIFFVILTINEVIIFMFFDPLFQVLSLVLRNMILFSLSSLFYLLIFIGKRKNYLRKMIFFFLAWNMLYIAFIIFPESIINNFGIFNVLKNFDIIELGKLILLNIIVIYVSYLKLEEHHGDLLE